MSYSTALPAILHNFKNELVYLINGSPIENET